MGSLELNPPLLIMTMGAPGSGKTFFARQFAELHNLPRLSEDRLRFELFERPQFNQDETDIIARILDYATEQTMRTKTSLVLDGDFSGKRDRDRVNALAKAHDYRTLIVWLQADQATAKTRALSRDRRNPDSKYSFNIDEQTFNQIASKLIRPGEKEASVVISGKHSFKGQSLTILRKITEIYADALRIPQNGPGSGTDGVRPPNGRPLVQ